MFELKQKILAAIQDLVRMAHRIGKHSVSDLLVRRAQIPLGDVTVETRAQYTTHDWDASKQNCTGICGVTVIRRVMQGYKNDAFLTFYIIFYCFLTPFSYYLHFLFFCFVRACFRVCVCMCETPFDLSKYLPTFTKISINIIPREGTLPPRF